jgi:hypothetical protein
MTQEYEFRSRVIKESIDEYRYNQDYRQVEKTCNEWAAEGFEIFSVVGMKCNDHGRIMVRLTARRRLSTGALFHKNTGRKFK